MIHSGGTTKQFAIAAIGTALFLCAPLDRAQAGSLVIGCEGFLGQSHLGPPPNYPVTFAGYLVFTNTSAHDIKSGHRIYYRFQTATGYGPQHHTLASHQLDKHTGTQTLSLKGGGSPCKAYYTYPG